ncbi:AAA family ATPase [Alteribacillus sp. HJP-4]|uniref:ATP-binding protein n=1 Tax=Alteribacillus sp. HJP-4 TaxID=2775394 RepID=UPI0035CD1557
MKIIRLHIYGFGRWNNETLDIEESFMLICGNNEAGKSTLRAFIQAVLFGFPTKKEKQLRYEPKTGSSYGGKITIQLEDGEIFQIERVLRQKSSGDISVFGSDGASYGEAWLHSLLNKMDKSTFQGIFCFGLDGLSEIQQLQGDELNQYLYEAGMTGTKRVAQLEKETVEKLSSLFKPRGQKPLINEELRQLKDIYQQVHGWEKEIDRYEILLSERKAAADKIEAVQLQRKQLKKQLSEILQEQALHSIFEEKQVTDQHLQLLEDSKNVPLEKKEDWDDLNRQRRQLTEQQTELTVEMKQKHIQCKGASNSRDLQHWIEKINTLKERLSFYHKNKEDLKLTTTRLNEKLIRAEDLLKKVAWSEEQLKLVSDITIDEEENLLTLIKKSKKLQERNEMIEDQLQKDKLYSKELDAEIVDLIKKLDAAEQDQKRKERTHLEKEAEKLAHAKGMRSIFMLLWASIVIFLSLGVWEMASGFRFIGATMLFAGFAAALLYLQQREKKDREIENDEKEHEKIELLLEQNRRTEIEIKEKEWQHERVNQQIFSHQESLYSIQEAYTKNKDDMIEWCNNNNIPAFPSADTADQYFYTLKEWIEIKKSVNTEIKGQETLISAIEKFEHMSRDAAAEMDVNVNKSAEEIVFSCQEQLKHYLLKNDNWIKEAEQYVSMHHKKRYLSGVLKKVNEEIRSILIEADIGSEAEFLEGIKKKQEYENFREKQRWLQSQLLSQLGSEEKVNEAMMKWQSNRHTASEEEELNSTLDKMEQQEKEWQRKDAELGQQIKRLEQDGTYEKVLQEYAERKASFQENVYDWLKWKTASLLLKKAKSRYEKERQPEVIQLASKYFHFITEEEYTSLFTPMDGKYFQVERNDGMRFSVEELSRGTAEQLYLSLRLALAEVYNQYSVFPLIMDDPFVNFDSSRKKAAFRLLNEISAERQVIYFTCHKQEESFIQDHQRLVL